MSTRVFVIDDSALVRQFMGLIIAGAPGLSFAGSAPDPILGLERMRADWPDVVVLDIEMPKMDGLTFLRQLMATRPTPVVVCSSLAGKGTELCVEALAAGAVAVFEKARLNVRERLEQIGEPLVQALKEAGAARLPRPHRPVPPPIPTRQGLRSTTDKVVAIGTSTGGTLALEHILTRLPADAPGLVIVQHMPERFTAAFASRLNHLCTLRVSEAQHGDSVSIGRALIAPGGQHMRLVRSGGHYCVELSQGPPVNRHRPSVDVLFRSVAECAGRNALGLLLTGMGDDGAEGLLAMRQTGAATVGQDEASCVVFGMPKEARARGATERMLPLSAMPQEILRFGHAGG